MIAGVVALVVLAIPCVYLIVKRKRKNERKQAGIDFCVCLCVCLNGHHFLSLAAEFLDEVYNTPVTFVNQASERISPRSPQLYIPSEIIHSERGAPVIIMAISQVVVSSRTVWMRVINQRFLA